jgi:WS/DGAT/MGAT family acyltransferase
MQRLSPLDASFLYFERPNQPLHVGCVALLERTVPFDVLTGTLAARLGALERYRQRPIRPLLDLDRPAWANDRDFDIHRHVRHLAVPPPGDDAELRALVDMLFATPIDPAHPLWEMYLIEGVAGGGAALLSKVHHCMIDGVSGAQVLEAITDAAPSTNGPIEAISQPASRVRSGPFATLAAALATVVDPARIRARAREAAGAASTIASLARHRPPTLPFNGRLSDARRIVWTSFALDDLLAMRGSAGCKVNDVVLTVIAGALARYLTRQRVPLDGLHAHALVPVSVRRGEERLALGNLVSAMLPRLPLDLSDPVARLHAIASEMRALKEQGQAHAAGLILSLAGALPAPLGPLLGRLVDGHPPFNTICTNVPGPREIRYLAGSRVIEVHPIVPLFHGVGLGFAILSYASRLSITVNADPRLVPDAESLHDDLAESADELHAGLAVGVPREPALAALGSRLAVGALMTREVITIAPHAPLSEAYRTMHARRIRHLPVIDEGRLVGLVTHRDLLAAAPSSLAFPEDVRVRLMSRARAADVMETHLSTALPDEPAAEAGERMVRHKIGCLPVVEDGGRLVGIVTDEDFLRWAAEHMAAG